MTAGSLSTSKGFVADAFFVAPQAPFVPETIELGEYTYLPWVRSGIAAALTEPAAGAARATVTVGVTVEDETGPAPPVIKTMTLRGPGDVIAIDPSEIVRRVPVDGAENVEESYLAAIEFNRPELPWLFSPRRPSGDRLQPWLALVVCDAAVSRLEPGPAGLPQQLVTQLGELQPLDDAWAWAHGQLAGALNGARSIGDRLTDAYTVVNLSRILCPRKLDPQRSYIACLVPTYHCGVLAGLGLGSDNTDPLDLAWHRQPDGGDAAQRITLPAYDSWSFSVGPAGDFESLAMRIIGIPAPWSIGRRIIDASDPRGGMAALAAGAPGAIQVLHCALVSPAPPPPGSPSDAAAWSPATRDALRKIIDTTADTTANAALPRVGPRLYASFQRAQRQLGKIFGNAPSTTATATPTVDNDWFPQLNTSPLHRVVAGLGTRVVQRDREHLMQAAWLQVGDIIGVNQTLTRIQFGRFLGESLHERHLQRLALGDLAQLLRGVQGKLRATGSLTVQGMVATSAAPGAAMSAAFRQATRLRGPLARRAKDVSALRQVLAANDVFKDLRRTYVEPEGIGGLSAGAIATIPVDLLAGALRVPAAQAQQAASAKLGRKAGAISVADRLLAPLASWRVPAGTIDLGALAAARVSEAFSAALPARLAGDGARAEALAPILVGLANAHAGDVSTTANQSLQQIHQRLPFSPVQRTAILHPVGLAAAPSLTTTIAARRAIPPATALATPAVTVGATTHPAAPAAVVVTPTALQRFETPASKTLTDMVVNARAVKMTDVAAAFSQLAQGIGVGFLTATPDRAPPAVSRGTLLSAVRPSVTATIYATSRLARMPAWLAADWFMDGFVTPIMAAPRFDRAMYQALDAYNRDWLVPGLGTIRERDFATVLTTNAPFTEAFLIGLCDEMGRELLWRDYPTDQRGTYFRRFWDETKDELTPNIDKFPATGLGSHIRSGGGAAEGRVVLVVRGDLLRRYPDAMVVAVRSSKDAQGHPIFADPPVQGQEGYTLFTAHLDPDYHLVCFDLTATQLRNEPWWFIIAEHPTAPRFGLELSVQGSPPATAGVDRNALHWNDLGALAHGGPGQPRFLSANARTLDIADPASDPKSTTWPSNAAIVARTLLRNPYRAAFDAHALIAT